MQGTVLAMSDDCTARALLASSAKRTNRKKCAALQDDVERRIQPKHNAKKTTSYKDLDDHVIYKRTHSIDSSDMGVEDSASKRMDKNEAEYCPRGSDDKEYDNDEDELESSEFNSHCGAKVTPSMQMVFFFNHIWFSTPQPLQTQIDFTTMIVNINP